MNGASTLAVLSYLEWMGYTATPLAIAIIVLAFVHFRAAKRAGTTVPAAAKIAFACALAAFILAMMLPVPGGWY